MKKSILFISHQASRSGAPIVLLYLLQWLKQRKNYHYDVLVLKDGPLRKDFENVAGKVFIATQITKEYSLPNKIKRKLGYKFTNEKKIKKVGNYIKVSSYDLVYGNSIVSLEWLITFKMLYGIKVINAIHELQISMESYFSKEFLVDNLSKLDLIIAGSQAVANNLIKRYQVSHPLIHIIHAFIYTHLIPTQNKQLLALAGIPDGRFIIGGVGNADWRKGIDMVVPLGLYFKRHFPNFNYHIVWVGADVRDHFVKTLLIDIEKAGLNDKITILANTSLYLDYINLFDVFTMLSREDPFPLVSLEAAFLKKPIIMFKDTGGTAELLQNGGGKIVDYMDIEALAETILLLSQNKRLRDEMGDILRNEVMVKYDSEIACKKVSSIFESFI